MDCEILFRLPRDVIQSVFIEWLILNEIVASLDNALTNRSYRTKYLAILQEISLPFDYSVELDEFNCNNDLNPLRWFYARQCAFNIVEFSRNCDLSDIQYISQKMRLGISCISLDVINLKGISFSCIFACPNLQMLEIGHSYDERKLVIGQKLASLHRFCPNLTTIRLNFFSHIDHRFFPSLAHLPSLTELSLIGYSGQISISSALEFLSWVPNLTTLNLPVLNVNFETSVKIEDCQSMRYLANFKVGKLMLPFRYCLDFLPYLPNLTHMSIKDPTLELYVPLPKQNELFLTLAPYLANLKELVIEKLPLTAAMFSQCSSLTTLHVRCGTTEVDIESLKLLLTSCKHLLDFSFVLAGNAGSLLQDILGSVISTVSDHCNELTSVTIKCSTFTFVDYQSLLKLMNLQVLKLSLYFFDLPTLILLIAKVEHLELSCITLRTDQELLESVIFPATVKLKVLNLRNCPPRLWNALIRDDAVIPSLEQLHSFSSNSTHFGSKVSNFSEKEVLLCLLHKFPNLKALTVDFIVNNSKMSPEVNEKLKKIDVQYFQSCGEFWWQMGEMQ